MKITEARHGMRVRLISSGEEGTIVQIHFGAIEVDWGNRVTTVVQDARGDLPLSQTGSLG